MKSFGARLREIRGDSSQVSFCSKIGAKQGTYSAWERDEKEPSYKAIAIICKTFNVSADWLLGLTETDKGVDSVKVPSSFGVKRKVLELKDYANHASKKADELLEAIEKMEGTL